MCPFGALHRGTHSRCLENSEDSFTRGSRMLQRSRRQQVSGDNGAADQPGSSQVQDRAVGRGRGALRTLQRNEQWAGRGSLYLQGTGEASLGHRCLPFGSLHEDKTWNCPRDQADSGGEGPVHSVAAGSVQPKARGNRSKRGPPWAGRSVLSKIKTQKNKRQGKKCTEKSGKNIAFLIINTFRGQELQGNRLN